MRVLKADLHIHSCLSPCADVDMSPKRIVERAKQVGLDIIAICDHNSAENVEASVRAGMARGITVFPGMEINSREEVHILAIFENTKQALCMQESIYQRLNGENRPEVFGDQVVANEFDEVEGFNERLLIGSVNKGLAEIIKEIRTLGGLAIASHVDRPSFSILSQLGFIPQDIILDAIEVTRPEAMKSLVSDLVDQTRLAVIVSSDAHQLDQIGTRFTEFYLEEPSLQEVKRALQGKEGRRVVI